MTTGERVADSAVLSTSLPRTCSSHPGEPTGEFAAKRRGPAAETAVRSPSSTHGARTRAKLPPKPRLSYRGIGVGEGDHGVRVFLLLFMV